ncbi:MAG TPA: hypothetical protein DCO77_11550 [Nitrospiraceae bacterium]|nr:hypothetical protein [Nitrospiraceae bacterium]
MNDKRTAGFWIIMIVGMLLLVILVFGQAMSFINYDFAVSIGLQESREVIGRMGVAVNKGFGVGDTIIYLPLLLLGLIGLWSRTMWGVFAMAGALAITAYWPMVALFLLLFARGTPGFHFTNYTSYTIILTLFTLYGLWGLWYLYRNRKQLASE